MKNKNTHSNNFNELVLVPLDLLKKVQESQEVILDKLESIPNSTFNRSSVTKNWIPESEAKAITRKGTTWLWQMRKSGQLKFKKVGNSIFYQRESLEKLFNE